MTTDAKRAYVGVWTSARAYSDGMLMRAWASVVPPDDTPVTVVAWVEGFGKKFYFSGLNKYHENRRVPWRLIGAGKVMVDAEFARFQYSRDLLPYGRYAVVVQALNDDGDVIGEGSTYFNTGKPEDVAPILFDQVCELRKEKAERLGDPDFHLDDSNSLLVDAAEVQLALRAAYPSAPSYAFPLRDRTYRLVTRQAFRYMMLNSGIRRITYVPEAFDCDDFGEAQTAIFPREAAADTVWGQREDGTLGHAVNIAVLVDKWAGGGYRKVVLGEPQTGQVLSASGLDSTTSRWVPWHCSM